ncbi:hypothetical protein NX801_22000 [Streptomyces sp. LP05-1]|uniref:Uncharacterized protein n=1 Tax=Streptomyces pyxinae TaxID=2970734 RepID=A0ABT2CLH4_9ACTN|nr:hypothetical protein [Streptomyces sp. LP05-1]MCS0638276.1 hypothetical protein [Streptomyces sp. LP05-1]
MCLPSSSGGVPLDADALNDAIRDLWSHAGRDGRLSREQRAEYRLLVTAWAEAQRTEVVEAA